MTDKTKMWILYYIENKINGKLYIGKTNNLKRRFFKHKRDSENKPLNRAIKKYGVDSFSFSEFQIFSSEEECYEMERYWIQYLREQEVLLYNIAEGGNRIFSGSNHYLYGKHLSEETKKKISISHAGKPLSISHRENIRQGAIRSHIGNIVSQETRDKISFSKIGKPLSKEHKIKIGNSSRGRKHSTETKDFLSKKMTGDSNPFIKLTDEQVNQILSIWNSIDKNIRNKYGYKAKFYREYIKGVYDIKIITLYEYLKGSRRTKKFQS